MRSKIKKILVIAISIVIVLSIALISYNHFKKSYKIEEIFEEKYLLLSSNNKKGVIDSKGNVIIKAKYDDIHIPNPSKAIFVCYYNYNEADNTFRSKVVNENETELFTRYQKIETISLNDIETSMPYEKNVLRFQEDGKYGLIDLKGNVVVKAEYDSIDGLSNKEGELLVSKDGKYGVINTKGAELIGTEYDNVSGDGYYTSEKKYALAGYILGLKTADGYRYGYISHNFKKLLDVEYNEILRLGGIGSENTDKDIILVAKKGGQYGLIKNKKVIIDFKYQSIDYTGVNNLFMLTRGSKSGVYNSAGDKILAVKFDEVEVKDNYIFTKLNKEEAYYNLKGNRISKTSIEEDDEKDEEKEEKRKSGKLVPDEKDGKWGFIDSESNVKIDYIYDEVTELNSNGFAGIKLDGKWGSIDENGNIIVNPIYNLDRYYEINFIGKYYKVVYDYKTVYYSDDIN